MQFVDKKWYEFYRWTACAAASIALAITIASWVLSIFITVDYFSAALALSLIAYAIFGYPIIAKNYNPFSAAIGTAMLQLVVVLGFVHSAGGLSSIFLAWWILVILLSGTFGIVGAGGTALITVTYFIFGSVSTGGEHTYTLYTLIGLVAFLLLSLASHFIWRPKYTTGDSERVAALTGELKTNQKQSEILVESLTDGVMLVDTGGTITLINPAAAAMTGWSIEDATGTDCKLVLNLKTEEGNDLTDAENPLLHDTPTNSDDDLALLLSDRTGKQKTVSLIKSPIIHNKTQEVAGSVIVIRDISLTRQSEKQRAEFISTASHEMRTPVAAIEGYLQLALNDKVSKIDAKARGYLEKALDSTHHLGKLFQDLLTSAKAEDGRLVSHPEVIELGKYIEDLAESFKFSAEKKGLLTEFIFGKSASEGEHVVRPLYYVSADPDRLREVITNLFDNAVKYTPSGKISLGLTGDNNIVQLFVKDTGPGISPEDIPHLFQKFYRVDNSNTRTIGGTGLGLFICKKIIDLYNGRIWAESQVGHGSTFYINLPRLSAQQAQELERQANNPTEPPAVDTIITPV